MIKMVCLQHLSALPDVFKKNFFCVVCVASDTFIQTKEAPVAVQSVAANSRGLSWCCAKDEMFSL